MSAVKVPTGGYTEGYDAGLRDAKQGNDRALPKLRRRPSLLGAKWATYRVGYDDGFGDGEIVRARRADR
jgi:hypothetical protein